MSTSLPSSFFLSKYFFQPEVRRGKGLHGALHSHWGPCCAALLLSDLLFKEALEQWVPHCSTELPDVAACSLPFFRSAVWLLNILSMTEKLWNSVLLHKKIVGLACHRMKSLSPPSLLPFVSFFSNFLLEAELSVNCLCCHHCSLVQLNSSLANPGLQRGVQLIQLLSPKDPDLLLTGLIFPAKGTFDYSMPSWRCPCWWEVSSHQLFIPWSAADLIWRKEGLTQEGRDAVSKVLDPVASSHLI